MGTVHSTNADSVYALYAYGNTSYGTLSSFCFLLSGIFSDLLLIRWSLVFAYIFLIITILLGFPAITNWGMAPAPVLLAYGTLIWNVACLFFTATALWRTLWDERPVRFRNEDEECVWRCFHRRCGLARTEAKLIFRKAKFTTAEKGDVLYDDRKDVFKLNFIVEGLVHLQTRIGNSFVIGSGKFFDLRLFSLFGIFLGFEYSAIKTATARGKVLMMTWEVADVLEMASGSMGPAVANYWRAMALYTVAAELVASNGGPTYTSRGQPEGASWAAGARCQDLAEPPTPEEIAAQKTTVMGVLTWIVKSMSMSPPPGQRHHAAPASGALALSRILLEQHMQQAGSVVPRCLSLAADAPRSATSSSGAGAAFYSAMSSLRRRNPFRNVMASGGGGVGVGSTSERLRTSSTGTPAAGQVQLMVGESYAQPLFAAQQPSLIPEEDPSVREGAARV